MRFNLILDPGAEESVTVVAHCRSDFTDRLEALVPRYMTSMVPAGSA